MIERPRAELEDDGWPELTDAIMVAAFEGWNDAGDAASGAVEHLELIWDAQPLLAIDPDDYYDFQVNRPNVSLVDGVTRRVSWPTTRMSVCRPPGAAFDLVLVRGIEPNMRWQAFCDEILDVVRALDVHVVVTLGALLSDTPHTRATQVTGTSYDQDSAQKYGLERSQYEGPTGIVGVLQDACVTGEPAAVRAALDTLSWGLLDAMLKAAPRETLVRVAGLTAPFESQLSPAYRRILAAVRMQAGAS